MSNECILLYQTHVQVKNIRHNGNITMEDIYNAARVIRPKSLAQDFSGIFRHDDGNQSYLDGKASQAVPGKFL